MTSSDLLGRTACQYLKNHVAIDDHTGTARYLLDCLTAEQTASVASAILRDNDLSRLVEIRFPRAFLAGTGLPEEILTNERTTYFRNAACPKSAWLLANTGDDEQQGLGELVPIGAPQLLAHPELWVRVASEGLTITNEHSGWWIKALRGLVDAKAISLERFSEYVCAVRSAIFEHGQPVRCAVGYAFPALRVPRDTNYFNALNDKTSGHSWKWKNLFSTAFKKRAPYLVKQNPNLTILDEEALRVVFESVKESIPVEAHGAIETFIASPSGWNASAATLAEFEWELVKPMFDGLKREVLNLGQLTLQFYDDNDPQFLSADDRDYLERLCKRKTTDAEEEDERFYADHRLELKERVPLKAKWDKFIYGAPVESEDFISGLMQCMQALFDQDQQGADRRLSIRADARTRGDLKGINRDAGLFFAFRYRGIRELLGKAVTWDVGDLFRFPELDSLWRGATRPHVNRSIAKAALQIKFFLDLEVIMSNGQSQSYSKQLVWRFNANGIASEMSEDWRRLVDHPLVQCQVHRELVSGKGRHQSVDLQDVRTFLPTFHKDRGSLVSVYRPENDIRAWYPQNVVKAIQEQRISVEAGETIKNLFGTFADKYCAAVKEFSEKGVASQLLDEQLGAYSDLLFMICKEAKGDRNRESLLRPLLEIGNVPVQGGAVASITAPWHPLRIAAIAQKATQVAGLIRHLMFAENVFFGDTKLYFEELKDELDHPYYPEVTLGWREGKPEILALADHYLDYSLHEPPVIQSDFYADTDENPHECAVRVIDILKRYLALHPHEQANLSVVLYNCDSARLPQAIVEKIQEIHEEEEDIRCQVVLRHRNGAKLRELYERIIENSESDADSFVASEATRDFMARLRIGIMVDEAAPPPEGEGPPTDIVFLQDVIARHAQMEWYAEDAIPIPLEEWVPPRWSRRRPAASDDMKSVVYLCCPVASKEGWNYLTAITTFFRGDWDGIEDRRLLPARQLNFNDPTTAQIFKEVHNLGNWVVNYDELLDRRQLVNQHVKVIRYKQTETQGRNLLISSNTSTALLHRMVIQRLQNLALGLDNTALSALARQFISEANVISGDLVLRAAKRGKNASELMGVVLSRYLIRREIGADRYFGWYFLDDYASWLGQREEQIADILALSPETDSKGNMRLAVVISESKYIDHSGLSAKRKESQKQLRQTIERLTKALFGDPGRLDRDIWLSRFSDLVLNGIHFPANAELRLSRWRRAIREGQCTIYLRGYSHVFVASPSDCPECSEVVAVAECENAFQEVFSRSKLRQLVLHYNKDADPTVVRREGVADDIWTEKSYRNPSKRITTLTKPAKIPAARLTEAVKQNDERKAEVPVESVTTLPASDVSELTESSNVKDIPQPSSQLESHSAPDGEAELVWLKQVSNATKGALQQFQLQSKLSSVVLTPNAALLKFHGSANLTVEQVNKKRSEFLTTHGLNIISVKAEPGVVSIAIARPKRRVLMLAEVWKNWHPKQNGGNVELLLGLKEDDGQPLIYSPRINAPHVLVAGSTGSGKSVLMQNILLTIAATNTPQQAKIILIDPKMAVDYFAFEGLPHLQEGLITEQGAAVAALEGLVEEMDRRYKLLKENRVSNIFDLIAKPEATERPPVLWVIHDEFAEWMMTDSYKSAVEQIVGRLGVKARAAGIFLVFAAQRPDANVMPMQLRANLGNRLVLRVDGEGTSEIALGEKGAERLLGKGHLCAKLEGEPSLIFAQVPFVDARGTELMIQEIISRQ